MIRGAFSSYKAVTGLVEKLFWWCLSGVNDYSGNVCCVDTRLQKCYVFPAPSLGQTGDVNSRGCKILFIETIKTYNKNVNSACFILCLSGLLTLMVGVYLVLFIGIHHTTQYWVIKKSVGKHARRHAGLVYQGLYSWCTVIFLEANFGCLHTRVYVCVIH